MNSSAPALADRAEHLTGVSVVGAGKFIAGVQVLSDVTVRARPGSVTALLGPNGAGKTTLLRALADLVRLDAGVIVVDGHPVGRHPHPTTIGVLLDPDALPAGRTARGQLRIVAAAAGRAAHRIDTVLTAVGMQSQADVRIGEMSLGMRQRITLAAVLVDDPSVLLLDEPHNGLDVEAIRWLREMLRCFADAGRTVVISSHLLTEVQMLADDVVVIADGRVVGSGAVAEVVGTNPAPDALERWYFDRLGAR